MFSNQNFDLYDESTDKDGPSQRLRIKISIQQDFGLFGPLR